jgi:hypothetical protein
MKIDNLVIENQSPEFAVELKKFWKSMGVYIIWFDFSQNKKDGCTEIYYGVINGKFDNYFKKNIPPLISSATIFIGPEKAPAQRGARGKSYIFVLICAWFFQFLRSTITIRITFSQSAGRKRF